MTDQAAAPEAANHVTEEVMTEKHLKILESYAKQSIINLVDVCALMPRGHEFQAIQVAQKVVAKVLAVWFDEYAFDRAVETARSQFGEITVSEPSKISEWKDGVLEMVAQQKHKREMGAASRLILPDQNLQLPR